MFWDQGGVCGAIFSILADVLVADGRLKAIDFF